MSSNISSYFQVSEVLANTSPMVLYALAAITGLAMFFLAAHTSLALVAVLLTCLLMLAFAVYLAQWVIAKDEGTVDMQEVCSWHFPCSVL
jgi:VIT1/CCC1 family predicted Fe2+/Mn2+ transporter